MECVNYIYMRIRTKFYKHKPKLSNIIDMNCPGNDGLNYMYQISTVFVVISNFNKPHNSL